MSFFREIHRRSLWQILGIYLAGGWIAFQVVEALADNVGLPDWVPAFSIVLLVLGLPVVLTTAFLQKGGPRRGPAGPAPFADPKSAAATESASGTTEPTAATPATAATTAAAPAPAAADGLHHRLFTWKNAIAGGVLAFALLGVLAAGWFVMRTVGIGPAASLVAQGVFEERSTVVLAEFTADDAAIARAATEAFEVDLSQSQVVSLAEASAVRGALERMERPTDAPLDRQTALDLAVREGYPAVIAGDLNPVGDGYVATVDLLAAGTGDVLSSHRETASDQTGIIEAIDGLSKQLREKIGESLRTTRAEAPLEQVTTANLEALQKFSQSRLVRGVEGDDERAIELLEEALALDSTFAMAWRYLGIIYSNRAEGRAKMVEALTRAYENQDRLTEIERYLAQAAYYDNVVSDPRRAIRAYENALELDPEEFTSLNNIGILYMDQRDYERAIEAYHAAMAVDSTLLPPWYNLVVAQTNQGESEAARSTIASLEERFPGTSYPLELGAWNASSMGDYERSARKWERLRDQQTGELYFESYAAMGLAQLEAVRGRMAAAERLFRQAIATEERRGLPPQAFGYHMALAFEDLWARQDTAEALARIADALETYPLADMDPLDRPYNGLVYFNAAAGWPEAARDYLAQLEAAVPEDRRDPDQHLAMRGAIALAEGRYEEAIDLLLQADRGGCLLCGLPELGLAYERSGAADSAVAVYTRLLERPFFNRLFFDHAGRGSSLERLAQIHDQRGDLENAARYYAEFVELWADADEELQPRVAAAQARLEEIVRETG